MSNPELKLKFQWKNARAATVLKYTYYKIMNNKEEYF